MAELNVQYPNVMVPAMAAQQIVGNQQRNALLQKADVRADQEYTNKRAQEALNEAAFHLDALSELPEEQRAAKYPAAAKLLKQFYGDVPFIQNAPDQYDPEFFNQAAMHMKGLRTQAALKRTTHNAFGPVFKHPETGQLMQQDAYGQVHPIAGSGPNLMQADEEKDIIDQRSGAVVRKGTPSPTKQIANYEAWTKLAAVQGTPIDNDVAVLFKLPGAMTPTDAITKIAEAKKAKTTLDKTSALDGILASLPAFQESGLSVGQKMDPKMKQEALDSYDRLITHLETFAGGAQPKATQGGGVASKREFIVTETAVAPDGTVWEKSKDGRVRRAK